MSRTYKLREPKNEIFSSIETNDKDMLSGLGNRFISLHYRPTDIDYQNAAISYMRSIGMNAADQARERELSLDAGQYQTMENCYYFGMRDLGKDSRKMAEYGHGYVLSVSLETGMKPLEVLDRHLAAIDAHYEAEHGAKPDNAEEYRNAVNSYYRDVLNFGREPYEIQAKMDIQAMKYKKEPDNDREFDDFADAVTSIPDMEQPAGLEQ